MGKTKKDYQAEYTKVTGQIPMETLTTNELKQAITDFKQPAKQTGLFEPKCTGKFWKSPISFHKFGTVTGAVLPEHEEEFEAVTPKETDIMKWVLDYDPIAKRRAEALKSMRKRAGLPDDK